MKVGGGMHLQVQEVGELEAESMARVVEVRCIGKRSHLSLSLARMEI